MGCGQDVTLDHEWEERTHPSSNSVDCPRVPISRLFSRLSEKKKWEWRMSTGPWTAGGAPLFRKFLSPTSVCHIFSDFFPLAIPSTCDSVCQFKSRGPYFFLRQSFPRTAPSSAVPIFGVDGTYVYTTDYSHKNIPFSLENVLIF